MILKYAYSIMEPEVPPLPQDVTRLIAEKYKSNADPLNLRIRELTTQLEVYGEYLDEINEAETQGVNRFNMTNSEARNQFRGMIADAYVELYNNRVRLANQRIIYRTLYGRENS